VHRLRRRHSSGPHFRQLPKLLKLKYKLKCTAADMQVKLDNLAPAGCSVISEGQAKVCFVHLSSLIEYYLI
jgi:hypothetical protein